MEFFQNNAIAGVPSPGLYYIYNYFSNTHPIFYIINYLRFDKITFSMILIKYQLDLGETTILIPMVTDINMNDFPTRQYITLGLSVRPFNFIPS